MELRLIDHRDCGGGRCKRCDWTGTDTVETQRPDHVMPADPAQFEQQRESCPCYEGYPIHMDVAQCTHADAPGDGEWCRLEGCPLVPRADRVVR